MSNSESEDRNLLSRDLEGARKAYSIQDSDLSKSYHNQKKAAPEKHTKLAIKKKKKNWFPPP